MKGVIPLRKLWSGDELKKMCEHIIDHSSRYLPERVSEAKEELAKLAEAEWEKGDEDAEAEKAKMEDGEC